MLTLQRRAAQAVRQAERVLARKRKQAARKEHIEKWKAQSNFIKTTLRLRKESRQQTKEDVLMGPIAPRRAVTPAEQEEFYALDGEDVKIEPMRRKVPSDEWALAVGDRVVLLKGPDRHKIGKISAIDVENSTVVVEGLNQYPFKVPEFFKKLMGDEKMSSMTREAPLHYDDVRLVYPLVNQETGVREDTVIAKVELKGFYRDRNKDKIYRQRFVAGSDFKIPWPRAEPRPKVDEPYDTRIMDVEEITYVPTLLQPPLPDGLIDELRNKYSKFRTRHDPEYIARKEVELAYEEEKLKKKGWRLDERGNLVKDQPAYKFIQETPKLPDNVLLEIGKFMAKKNPSVLAEVIKMRSSQASGESRTTSS